MSIFARIVLRYLAAMLVARGFLTEGDGSLLASDPDLAMLLEMGLGAAMGAAAEIWLTLERRWSKKVPADPDYSGAL